jgi:hypothetical protein
MGSFSIWHWYVFLSTLAFIWPGGRILRRAGYSRWPLLLLLPGPLLFPAAGSTTPLVGLFLEGLGGSFLVGLVGLYIFAFSKWPASAKLPGS